MTKTTIVDVSFDPEACVWIAQAREKARLFAEAATFRQLTTRVREMGDDLGLGRIEMVLTV